MLRSLLFPSLVLLSVLDSASAFSPSSSALRPTLAKRPSTTRQYVLGNLSNKKTKQTQDESEKSEAEQSTPRLNFFNVPFGEKAMAPVELPERDLLEEEQEMAKSLAGVELDLEKLLLPVGAAGLVAAAAATANNMGLSAADFSSQLQAFQADPQGVLQASLDGLGPLAIVYFGALYVAAELLAIPATPLTLSAGYLFGLTEGTLVVLAAGTLSAMIGFVIGKTFLRSWVESVLEENPQFKKLDTAIGAQGFKLLVLVRLSPIFPFALLNYTYGASSISFPTFVAGTLLGFAPSTLGYVYTGLVGKELLGGDATQPWYVYAAGVSLLLGFLKLVTDVATQVVEAIDEEP